MAAADYQTLVQEAYIAYYGRPADPAGLIYWTNQLDQAGGDLNQIINAFGNSSESTNLYSSGNLYTEINQIYQTLFGRDADSAGANYYVEQIQTGKMTLASIALNIYQGAQNGDADILAAKLTYATAFTNDLLQNTTAAAAYGGDTAAGNARTALQGVTDTASAQTAINNLSTTLSNIGAGAVTYLTTGADVVTGSNIVGSLTSYQTDGKGPTLNYNDVITGSTGGTNNTLTLNDDYASANDVLPLGASISNIQNVVLQTAGNAGGTAAFDTSNISGVTNLTVKSAGSGEDQVKAAATTAINVTHLGTDGVVDTFGGSAVTVTANGGDVYVGGTGLAGENPTGAVTITAANSGTVQVYGGSTVSITDAGQQSYIQVGTLGASVAAAEPTGAVTVNSTGAGTSIDVYGGTDVTVNSVGALNGSSTGNITIGGEATDGSQYDAPTGNVTVIVAESINVSNKTADSTVTVYGGANVSVTTNAGDVTVGGTTFDSAGTALLAGENATGTITVTDTDKAASVTVYGGTDVTVSAAGTGVTIGADSAIAGVNATGTVNVTQAGSGAVNVYGGTDVTVAAAGGAVTVGDDVYSAYPAGSVYAPSGAITITDTAAAAYDNVINSNANEVSVHGGTDVSVTTNAGDVKVGSWTGLSGSEPTGTVTVTDTSLGGVSVFGGTDVTVNAAGGHVTIGDDNKGAAPSGNVTVTQSAVETGGQYRYASSVNIVGGKDVTVNTTGGNVSVGSTSNAATGAVSITDTQVGVNTDAFSVIGGTTVNVTTTATYGNITVGGATGSALNSAGTALANAADYASGNVTIVNESLAGTAAAGASNAYGTGHVTVTTNGATSVSITGGTHANITDVESLLGSNEKAIGTSTLSSVTLDHVEGNSTITSDALTSLTLVNGISGTGAHVTIVNNTAAGYNLSLSIGGDGLQSADSVQADNASSITVADNGVASGEVDLTSAAATSLTVNTTAEVDLDVNGLEAVKTITLNNTAALWIEADDNAALTKIDASGAKGDVTAVIDQTVTSFTGGAGNDTVFLENLDLAGTHKVDGGAGVNTLVIADLGASMGSVEAPTELSTIAANFTNLQIDNQINSFFDASSFTGNLTAVNSTVAFENVAASSLTAVDSVVTFGNVAAGTTLTLHDGATATYALADPSGLNDQLTVTVGADTAGQSAGTVSDSGTVIAQGIENVTVDSQGNTAVAGSNTITITDDAVKSITVTGDESVTISTVVTDSGAVSTIDASGATGSVDVSGVQIASTGVAVKGGAGELIADGVHGGTAQQDTVSLSGNYIAGDVVTETINGTAYSYTVQSGDSLASIASGLASAVNAGDSSVTVDYTASATGFTVTSKSVGAALSDSTSIVHAADGTGTITAESAVPVAVGNSLTLTLAGNFVAGEIVRVTINADETDFTAIHTVTNTDTLATIAADLANWFSTSDVGANGGSGWGTVTATGSTITISPTGTYAYTVTTAQTNDTSSISVANTIANGSLGGAVDSFTTGSGGGEITLGTGGSNGGTGSETVNLSASTAVSDEIVAGTGTVAVYNGVAGGVTGFVVSANAKTADRLSFGVSVAALGNQLSSQNVATFVGTSLTSQAAAEGAVLANLTFTAVNGVLTFGASGTHTVSEFSTAQLIAAAQAIVESQSTPTVLEFVSGGNTYVVASTDAGGTLANASVTELIGVTGVEGFSSTAAGNTIVVDNFDASANAIATSINTGDAHAAVYDETGFARALLGTDGQAAGDKSTTLSNLAASAELDIAASATSYAAITTTQVGASGSNFLALDFAGTATLTSLTVNGDSNLAIATSGADVITALVDGTNSVSTITVASGSSSDSLTIGSVTDTALKTVDASGFNGSLILTASQNGLTIDSGTSANTITASGAADTINVGSSDTAASGATVLTANGAADAISLNVSSASHLVQASGAGDTINIDGSSSATVNVAGAFDSTNAPTAALGHGDTINLSGSSVTDNVWVGGSSTVNLGSTDHYFGGTANITVTGDVTGATSSGNYAQTLININDASANLSLTFNNANSATVSGTEALAGGSAYTAQVNVASATSLSQALDVAIKQALVIDYQQYQGGGSGHTTVSASGVLELNANSGLITTFQYAGNTYVVEAVNNTNAAAAHAALGANDVVVELTGTSSVSNVTFSGHTLSAHVGNGVIG